MRAQVRRLAQQIDSSAAAESDLVLVVLKGAVIFASDLVRAMNTPTEHVYVAASSYSDGFDPGASLELDWTPGAEIEHRHVLVVDDIADTGRTLGEIERRVGEWRPASVSSVTLINKTARREDAYSPSFSGFQINEEFIYGYGLDWDEKYRDLPFVAVAG